MHRANFIFFRICFGPIPPFPPASDTTPIWSRVAERVHCCGGRARRRRGSEPRYRRGSEPWERRGSDPWRRVRRRAGDRGADIGESGRGAVPSDGAHRRWPRVAVGAGTRGAGETQLSQLAPYLREIINLRSVYKPNTDGGTVPNTGKSTLVNMPILSLYIRISYFVCGVNRGPGS